MTAERDPRTTLHELRARLQAAPAPRASEAFRTRVREQFVGDDVPRAQAPPVGHGHRAAPFWGAAIAAAAASLLLVAALLDRGPSWRLHAVTGDGAITVDGRVLVASDATAIAERIASGASVSLPEDVQLDLELPGVAHVQLAPGSRARLPRAPGRWFSNTVTATLEAGEMRVSTTADQRAAALRVRTPEIEARVTGTTYAVLRLPAASCVCVLEGGVLMTSTASADTVRAGSRRSIYRDGRPALIEPILPMESMKLGIFRDQVRNGQRP